MDKIEEFIKRRFPTNNGNWTNGNCFFFAVILRERFADFDDGWIVYEPITGHFLFKYNNCFYDWTGKVELTSQQLAAIVYWHHYDKIDSLHYWRIVDDCIR